MKQKNMAYHKVKTRKKNVKIQPFRKDRIHRMGWKEAYFYDYDRYIERRFHLQSEPDSLTFV